MLHDLQAVILANVQGLEWLVASQLDVARLSRLPGCVLCVQCSVQSQAGGRLQHIMAKGLRVSFHNPSVY
jgi:hypothetical protein